MKRGMMIKNVRLKISQDGTSLGMTQVMGFTALVFKIGRYE